MKTYTTIQGDMWDSIAHTQMGSVEYTDKLMQANQQYLGFYSFPAGVILSIPDPEKPVSQTLPPWRWSNEQ